MSISMRIWTGSEWKPDWSYDFFEAGGLPHVWLDAIGAEAYQVENVDYCVDQAIDWAKYRGDYYDLEAKKADWEHGLERDVYAEMM